MSNCRPTGIIQSTMGAGLCAQIKFIIQHVYLHYFNNTPDACVVIDFSQEYFPYKDSIDKCEFHNIMSLKQNIKIDDDLKIYDIMYQDIRPFNNFIFYDQTLVKHIKGSNEFDRVHGYRFINNKQKQDYLIKLNKIFNTIFDINKNILSEVDNYYNKYMKDNYVVTIHYRANTIINCELSGSGHENYYANINKIFDKIDNIIRDKPNFKVYLSTDVKVILSQFIDKYKNNLLYNVNNQSMCETPFSVEPHFGFDLSEEKLKNESYLKNFHMNKPGLNGGIQLLIDVLTLSKGNIFIPSLSNLSDIVLILNPTIEYSYL